MPLPTLAGTVLPTGITIPSYADILQSLQESFRAIYGSDAYIAPDSQDGQWLAILASGINDTNNLAVAVYNSFSPTYAQGAGLSSLVKINGIQRHVPTFSTAVGEVIGQAGVVITNGVVADVNGSLWNLPASITIPISGSVFVTVTAQAVGAVTALAGTINQINTPTQGWQSFVSTSDAIPGAAVETDAALRRRQTLSTGLPAVTPLGGTYGVVANLDDVLRVKIYENSTGVADANGLPPHSFSVVTQGGDVQEIVNAIGSKKTPGAATYGTTSGVYTDPLTGINYTIHFFVLAEDTVKIHLTITALSGFSTPVETEIKASLAAYINALGIGDDVAYTRLFGPAYLSGSAHSQSYEVTGLTIALNADPPGVIDLPVAFNHAATCDPDVDVTITVV